jgi:conjugal transfer pilus assembly protein TraF
MRLTQCILSLSMALILHQVASAQTDSPPQPQPQPQWWEGTPWIGERPFHFYPELESVAKPPPKAPTPPKQSRKFEDLKTVKEIKEEHDRLLDVAVVNPTVVTVLAYHEFKTKMLAQSEKFSSVSQAVIWQNPSIDYNATNPVANFAQTSQRIQKNRDEEQLLRDLSRTHGIVFFARSDCGPCHAQAPIFVEMQRTYGINVLAVSLDGGRIPGFDNARPDNGISKRLTGGRGVEVTPMSFLVSKDLNEVKMLGAGILAEDEILNRIRLIKTRAPEAYYTPYWAGQQQAQQLTGRAQ